ncbi:diaminopimelate epimerase [Terribacillus sp. AE2B 122]|jgi:diaminopimelate epimerase|uniref:diaminopimelate epimerase n=1 Tax=Terribacillus sp. AE2B 122 TaxID=1331902 RepID=UPI0014408AB6|nr:diaminopimelate epimerase [Terribacillus sp. AE2B 122]VVM35160.1 Diaminopimelate epimerase (EC 5.1.1.7) [Terribacillus sp. AE2B 122]
MEIPFVKLHGLKNSYIFINLFQFQLEEEMLAPLAIAVADRDTGIGSDGLILIHPSETCDVGMRVFNLDGSEAMNCGNGLRCVAKYAYENDLVERDTFTIQTKAGQVEAKVHGSKAHVHEVTVDMGAPILQRELIPMLGEAGQDVVDEVFEAGEEQLHVTAVSMGNPHAVFFVDNINEAPLYTQGPVITKDPRFPEGVNVEFIEMVSNKEMHFRVWERGSGVTQACGTGACAAVVAAIQNGKAPYGEEVTVHLSGGDLFIRWEKDGSVWMRGAAEKTVSGTFYWEHSA